MQKEGPALDLAVWVGAGLVIEDQRPQWPSTPRPAIPGGWEPCCREWTLARGHRRAGNATCSSLCHQVKTSRALSRCSEEGRKGRGSMHWPRPLLRSWGKRDIILHTWFSHLSNEGGDVEHIRVGLGEDAKFSFP